VLSRDCPPHASNSQSNVHRPGVGGSTEVPLSDRISIFLETVPLLLAHLGIKHISLASHSAGTIYALNLLHSHRELLSPSHPQITLMSPWVHQSHTSVSFLVAAANLPNPLMNYWNDINGLVWNSASPSFASSSGALSALSGWFSSTSTKAEKGQKESEREEEIRGAYGMSGAVKSEVERLTGKYVFEESTRGVNDEARLCLKSTVGTDWLACEDYVEYVEELKEFWEKKVAGKGGEAKLRVKIVLAEDDLMVGEKGKKYFQDVWTQEKCGQGIDVQCLQLEKTDHDSVTSADKGYLKEMFAAATEGHRTMY